MIIGWFIADLLSGIFHYIIDNGNPNWPILGKMVKDFKTHHDDPKSFLKVGVLGTIYQPALFGLLVSSLVLVFPTAWLLIFTVAFGSMLSQLSHKWAHQERCPLLVTFLQDIGILISPKRHDKHHCDFNKDFCILNGWANPLLNTIVKRKLKHGI